METQQCTVCKIPEQTSESRTRVEKLSGAVLKRYQRRVDVLKAMAHPTRLFMLDMLKNGERCVCEINENIDADVSTISKHLSLLKNAGLVSFEKRGLNVYYRLEAPCLLESLACVDDVTRR
jgi:ArsR family transcriptional regulator